MLKILGLLASGCFIIGLAASVFSNTSFNANSRNAQSFYDLANAFQPHRKKCNGLYNKGSERVSCRSLYNPDTDATEVFLWGDSHADMMIHGFEKIASEYQFNLEYSILPGCQIALEMQRADTNRNCAAAHDRVAQYVKQSEFPLIILMSSFVENTVSGKYRSIHSTRIVDPQKSVQEFSDSFKKTVALIKNTGATIVVLTEPPRHELDPVIEKVKHLMVGRKKLSKPVTLESHQNRIKNIYQIIENQDIDLRLDFSDFYCSKTSCRTEMDGKPLYSNRSHISAFGSTEIAKLVAASLVEAGYLKR